MLRAMATIEPMTLGNMPAGDVKRQFQVGDLGSRIQPHVRPLRPEPAKFIRAHALSRQEHPGDSDIGAAT